MAEKTVLNPVIVGGGQPSVVDELGYDPLHPSWATEVHKSAKEGKVPEIEHAGQDEAGRTLVKLPGGEFEASAVRAALDAAESSVLGGTHLVDPPEEKAETKAPQKKEAGGRA